MVDHVNRIGGAIALTLLKLVLVLTGVALVGVIGHAVWRGLAS